MFENWLSISSATRPPLLKTNSGSLTLMYHFGLRVGEAVRIKDVHGPIRPFQFGWDAPATIDLPLRKNQLGKLS